MTSLLILGFLIGMRHAIEADHVAAVATLVSTSKSTKQSIWHGVAWGAGHTLTLFLFGSVVIMFNGTLSESTASWLEFSVGILLVLLGLDVIRRLYKERIHFHLHQHENQPAHFHAHSHCSHSTHNKEAHQHSHSRPSFPLRALFVGLIHGMAGASALILLTVSKIDSPVTAMIYIAMFGIGSMAGMAVLSVIIAWPLRRSARGMTGLHNGVHFILGSFTVALGVSVILENYPG